MTGDRPSHEPVAPELNTGSAPAGDLPLTLWRRLDWRFLLPSLTFARIGCNGSVDDELLAALRALDPRADDLRATPGAGSPPIGQLDAVISIRPTRAELQTAVEALKSDGWIYAEVRLSTKLRSEGPRTVWGWQRALQKMGLQDVELFWHAPNIANSARILPVRSWSVMRDTLNRRQNVRFGLLKSTLGKMTYRLGLFPLAMPEGSIVGRRSAPAGPR